MQTLRSILKIGPNGAELVNENGSSGDSALEIMLGTSVRLEFELRKDNGSTTAPMSDYPLSGINANGYYFALNDTLNCDTPKLLCTSGITLAPDPGGRSLLTVEIPNTAANALVQAMGNKSDAEFICELGGVDSSGITLFAWQFNVTVRNRLYPGGGTASVAGDPAYYTSVQVEAALGRQLVVEYSADQSSWHSALAAGDLWMRLRHGALGTPSEAQAIPYGPAGQPGAAGADGAGLMIDAFGLLSEREEPVYSPFCFYATDTQLVYFWDGFAWSSGVSIAGGAAVVIVDGGTASTATIASVQGNHKYKFGTLSSLTITAVEVSDAEAVIEFVSGGTATVLDVPSTLQWLNGSLPTVDADTACTISIVNNRAVFGSFAEAE